LNEIFASRSSGRRTGNLNLSGNINAASFDGDGSTLEFQQLVLLERSADPADPPEGVAVIWLGDGTGTNDDGDVSIKVTAGGATKTAVLFDFSAA